MPVCRFVIKNIWTPVDRPDISNFLYRPQISIDTSYVSDQESLAGCGILFNAAGHTLACQRPI